MYILEERAGGDLFGPLNDLKLTEKRKTARVARARALVKGGKQTLFTLGHSTFSVTAIGCKSSRCASPDGRTSYDLFFGGNSCKVWPAQADGEEWS